MEKKILTVYTGGTICTASTDEGRELAPSIAKRALLKSFRESESDSPYAKLCEELFEDSCIPPEHQTLSENMTLAKLEKIIEHVKSFELDNYRGVMILHGTDTLAFSASLLSFVFSGVSVPIMLVSGNRPPMDERSNATANFSAAVELIMKGIAPNVYVPYRNSDGVTYVHLGSSVMQCANYSEDFFSPEGKRFALTDKELFLKLRELSGQRRDVIPCSRLCENVLLLQPYTGLDYSRISIEGIVGVVHGSYHSGTVCAEGERKERTCSRSLTYFADRCKNAGIPLFIAPSCLGRDQYSSMHALYKGADVQLLDMTVEAAYMKLVVGASLKLSAPELKKFMIAPINNEFNS